MVKGLRWAALGVLIAIAVLLSPAAAEARPFDPIGHDWEGYSDFVRLTRDALGPQVIVTGSLDWTSLRADDAVLLVFPEHPVDVSSAGAFVRAGGRLALFDDFGPGDDLLSSFDIARVPLPRHPRLALRENPDLAIAEPGDAAQPLTDGVLHLVTNHASGLRQPKLTTVLHVQGDDGDVAVAMSGQFGAGKLLAVGDPSFAMNSMLRYQDNRAFALNVGRYLTEGRARGRLFVVIGRFVESGTFRGASSESEHLKALEQSLRSITKEGIPPWMLYWFALVVAVLIGVWVIPRTTRIYRPHPPRFTRGVPLAAQGGVAGHAAALAAKHSYRGYAMLEWRRALMEDLTSYLGVASETSSVEVMRRVSRLGVVDPDALRRVERVLLRMAEIDTMIAAKQTHALDPIKDDEVVQTGRLFQMVLTAVHSHTGALP